MNSQIWKCTQCNKHTKMKIKDDIININCQCGYHSTMKIKEYIKDCKRNKSHITIKDYTFKDITTDIKKGNEHLLTYFTTIKKENINRLIAQINELESSYEKSYNRNKDILTFLEILINNYDGSNEMRKNILDYDINIYQFKDRKNINEVIEYFNEYNIIQKKIIIQNVKTSKIITDHTDSIYSLLRLKDGRVASCSSDKTIRIYDPYNDYYCCDQVIKRHSKRINSICHLDDGTIVSCSDDKSIMIENYTIKNAHNDEINKVITLPNNRLASCSDDKTIKIWKSNKPYSDTPIKILIGHTNKVNSLLYIKERDFMISWSHDETNT